MKIAVTGATGHIGREVCRLFNRLGHEVRAYVRTSIEGFDASIQQIEGDILDEDSLRICFENCDAVIHSAGKIDLGYSIDEELYSVNVLGTKNVLKIAKHCKVNKVINVSSIDMFDFLPIIQPVSEMSSFVTDDSIYYDQTKRDAYFIAKTASEKGQFVVSVCPTAVLGAPDEKLSKLGKAVLDIYRGRIPAIVKGGYDFVDVQDVAKGIALALERGKSGETYILGGNYCSLKDFSKLILQTKGKRKALPEVPLFLAYIGIPFVWSYAKFTKSPPLYDKVYLDILRKGNPSILSDKAKRELGYQPRSLEETINELINWFKSTKQIP